CEDGRSLAMSTVVPEGRDAMIEFYLAHQSKWEENMLSIGLTQPEIDDMKAKLDAVVAQQANAVQARQDAQMATQQLNTLADLLRATGALTMMRIRTYAESTGNPEVYTLAGLPLPKPPTPAPPPESPTMFEADPFA